MKPARHIEPIRKRLSDLSIIERKRRIEIIKDRIEDRQFNHTSLPLYDDPIDLQIMIDEYFTNGIERQETIVGTGSNAKVVEMKIATVTGLSLFLGFESRQSFYDMEKQLHLSYIIKRARDKIATYYEGKLSTSTPTGAIFALKNMGWHDKTEQTINQTIREVKVSVNQVDTNELISTI